MKKKNLKRLPLPSAKRLHKQPYLFSKAGLSTCFFLLIITISTGNLWAQANKQFKDWKFDEQLEDVYRRTINLETAEALKILSTIREPGKQAYVTYLKSFAETVELLITENEKRFSVIEKSFDQRIEELEEKPQDAETLFLLAELNLQRGFVYLNFGQQFNAVLAFRQSFTKIKDCLELNPGYPPAMKTNGVLQVMVGTIPDKFRWFFSLLGMEGSVTSGQNQLNELRKSGISLSREAGILYFTVKGLISQDYHEGLNGLFGLMKEDPNNRVLHFLAITMLMKESRSEEAWKLIQRLDQLPGGLRMIYMDYLRAEILLQKGSYTAAIPIYQKFIATYPGSSLKKDASLKIAFCHYLLNQRSFAVQWWEKAKVTGQSTSEPDILASEILKEEPFPNPLLLRVRFSTDGGYLAQAKEIINSISPGQLKSEKDRIEFIYRKARLEHRLKNFSDAKRLYVKTIESSKSTSLYFSASSALQLGYLHRDAGDWGSAKKYFELALTFKGHPYKYSIDGKAKAALEEIMEIRR